MYQPANKLNLTKITNQKKPIANTNVNQLKLTQTKPRNHTKQTLTKANYSQATPNPHQTPNHPTTAIKQTKQPSDQHRQTKITTQAPDPNKHQVSVCKKLPMQTQQKNRKQKTTASPQAETNQQTTQN